MSLQQTIRKITPPVLYDALLKSYRYFRRDRILYWEETSYTWAEAQKKCGGYSAESILEKVKWATTEVVAGRAAYERDSVLFFTKEYNLQLLASIEFVALQQKSLQVIDFGGALGSSYHQHQQILHKIPLQRWTVVEQSNYVQCGQAHFSTAVLKFASKIADLQETKIDIIIFSCVLHYLEHPFQFIDEAIAAKIPYLFIDRTPFSSEDKDIISIQHIPEKIYKASYVCRIFSESLFMQKITQHYEIIWSFENDIQIDIACSYKGMLLKLK